MSYGDSPFSPGKPVTPELFVGREEEILRLQTKLRKCANGSIESMFLTGERGIGKSSFARVMGVYAATELRLTPVHCQMTAAKNLDDVLQIISQKIIQQFPQDSVLEKIKTTFARYIDDFDLKLFPFGARVTLKKDANSLQSLRLTFPDLIVRTIENIKETANGLLLILDDLNGVTKDPDFGNFIKHIVDGLVTGGHDRLPLAIMLVGIEERLDDMINQQPSVGRIFHLVQLHKLTNDKVRQFFRSAFTNAGLTITSDALSNMTFWSGGMPAVMHETGEGAFWANNDNEIDENDAWKGCFYAAKSISTKYLEPRVFNKLKSKSYRNILESIARSKDRVISRRQLLNSLNQADKPRLDNFFRKMVEAGVLGKGETFGEYHFEREIYHLYNLMRHVERSRK